MLELIPSTNRINQSVTSYNVKENLSANLRWFTLLASNLETER